MGLTSRVKDAGKAMLGSDTAKTGAKWGLAAANGMGANALTGAVGGAIWGAVDEDTSIVGGALFGAAAGAIVPGALKAAKGAWDDGAIASAKAAAEDGLGTAEKLASKGVDKVEELRDLANERARSSATTATTAGGASLSSTRLEAARREYSPLSQASKSTTSLAGNKPIGGGIPSAQGGVLRPETEKLRQMQINSTQSDQRIKKMLEEKAGLSKSIKKKKILFAGTRNKALKAKQNILNKSLRKERAIFKKNRAPFVQREADAKELASLLLKNKNVDPLRGLGL